MTASMLGVLALMLLSVLGRALLLCSHYYTTKKEPHP